MRGTDADRARHGRVVEGCPSSPTDAEWSELERLIPPAKPGGRPRETDMRAAADALLYLLRTGCPWRYLPRDGRFPPRSTVYNIFRGFQRDGVWEAIAATLVEAERQRQEREADPTAGLLDGLRSRCPHLELVWADAGYLACHGACVPGDGCRLPLRQRCGTAPAGLNWSAGCARGRGSGLRRFGDAASVCLKLLESARLASN